MTDYLQPPLEANPLTSLQQFNEYMEAAFPGWTPAPGNLDARIGGAGSQMAAQLREAASDGATNFFRFFGANIAGLPPHEATAASGITTWVLTDTLGHTIPTGTIAIWTDGLGNRWGFETLEPVVVAVASKEATGVAVRAVQTGAGGNGLSGAAAELGSPLAFVASVSLPSPTNGGTEAESDAAYLSRLVEENKILTPKPITPKDFNILLTSKPGVGRCTTIGGFNPTGTVVHTGTTTSTSKEITGLTTPVTEQLAVGTEVSGVGITAGALITEVGVGTIKISIAATATGTPSLTFTGILKVGGYVASWLGTAAGEALGSILLKELEAEVQAECLAGVVFKALSPTYTTINVAATVFAWPGQNAAVIKEAVEAAIRAFLSPERWGQPPTGQGKEWNNDPKVRLVNAEHAILQIIGTHYVSSLELNAAALDVTMAGVVALPKLGTLAVTVNIG